LTRPRRAALRRRNGQDRSLQSVGEIAGQARNDVPRAAHSAVVGRDAHIAPRPDCGTVKTVPYNRRGGPAWPPSLRIHNRPSNHIIV